MRIIGMFLLFIVACGDDTEIKNNRNSNPDITVVEPQQPDQEGDRAIEIQIEPPTRSSSGPPIPNIVITRDVLSEEIVVAYKKEKLKPKTTKKVVEQTAEVGTPVVEQATEQTKEVKKQHKSKCNKKLLKCISKRDIKTCYQDDDDNQSSKKCLNKIFKKKRSKRCLKRFRKCNPPE